MNILQGDADVSLLRAELWFAARSPALLLAAAFLLLLTLASVFLGLAQVREQRATIEEIRAQDTLERETAIGNATDYGGAAYDSFYATWNPPSALAFAALGQRDVAPYVLRIRALALEGQIYETDNLNPVLLQAGRFDYAFLLAYLVPLFAIFLLFDLTASERETGRYGLLVVSAGDPRQLWLTRALVRVGLLLCAVLPPFWLVAAFESAPIAGVLAITLIVLAQVLFWSALTGLLASRAIAASVVATLMVGVWLLTAVLMPMIGKIVIEQSVEGVHGAEIALLQREVVNDAWDIPKATTMDQFYAAHPTWADSAPISAPFHWKWYYAFQQVGDEAAGVLATTYTAERMRRHELTERVAWLSPAVATQLALQRLAATGTLANLAYEQSIRRFHGALREFYYPLLFREVPFEQGRLTPAPSFEP